MNINNVKYINEFKKLRYPKNEMLIVGTGVMALLELKENKDIDIWCSQKVFEIVAKDRNYIEKKSKTDGFPMYERKDGKIEFMNTLPPLREQFQAYVKRAVVVDGIYFQHPKDVLKWKQLINRPKDRQDIITLKNYLRTNVTELYLRSLK
jgi:hypothetical protein